MNTADQASGWQIPVLALAIVLLAPLTEELLFRGTLLRSLLRKMSPGGGGVRDARWCSAWSTCWAIPSVGTLIALPGDHPPRAWCRATRRVRTGNLSRSILLHMGFNALSVVVPVPLPSG